MFRFVPLNMTKWFEEIVDRSKDYFVEDTEL